MRFLGKNLAAAFVGAVAFVALSAASHATTVSIYSTGVDASGNVLANGSSDTHYTGGPNTVYQNGAYLLNDTAGGPGSAWLGGDSFPASANYTVHFTLTQTTDAILSGFWGVDNEATDILINGNSTGISLLGVVVGNFDHLTSFATTLAQSSFFHIGDNTLTFLITNADPGGAGAFRTAGLSVTATPIPPSILLFLTAIGGMGFVAYRRRSAAAVA